MSKYQEQWIEREFKGYGLNSPNPKWPGGAKVCISFVVQYNNGAVSLAHWYLLMTGIERRGR